MFGPPGSGKSTKAQELVKNNNYHSFAICSADDYFTDSKGKYKYNPNEVPAAHNQCFRNYCKALVERKELIIVDNCNVRLSHIQQYLIHAKTNKYEVHIVKFPFTDPKILFERNIHNVPLNSIIKMQEQMKYSLMMWPSEWPKPEDP